MTTSKEAWQMVTTAPGQFSAPPGEAEARWSPTTLPTTGQDQHDHWFRTHFEARPPECVLTLRGLATLCDVFIDGDLALRSMSMFARHDLPVTAGRHELAICARALTAELERRHPGRARWRTKVAAYNNLRWIRTSLRGRAPGFAPAPPVVGPWRPYSLGTGAAAPRIRTSVRDQDGIVTVVSDPQLGALEVEVDGRSSSLPAGGGEIRLPHVERWWPHTHGKPVVYPVRVSAGTTDLRRNIGFRDVEAARDPDGPQGLELRLNGLPIFVRGAVWTPVRDPDIRPTLERACAAGLNMIRVVGTMAYESEAFHDACDELGLMVWQDLMFANMDYPFEDEEFGELALAEAAGELESVAGRPSLVVVCGNSEVEQQVAMLGLDPRLGRPAFFETSVPSLLHELDVDAVYVRSAPSGGVRPFSTNAGVSNYFGVGAYRQPIESVRHAHVRFASECLAFAHVPDTTPADHGEGVMRDVGADWDFADVRDHYLADLYDTVRGQDAYWERSRFVTGELMADVFGEWRRRDSDCGGGIVLWLRDLEPGAGWGVLDSEGRPKLAYYHLRRALQPIAVWMTDEALNGVAVHVANDGPAPLACSLRIGIYRDQHLLVDSAEEDFPLGSHVVVEQDLEQLLGHFVDISYTHRYGPPQHDLVVASLMQQDRLLSQAFYFPLGRPATPRSAEELGLRARAVAGVDGRLVLELRTTAFTYGVRICVDGYDPDDNGFSIEPGGTRTVQLHPLGSSSTPDNLVVRALNLHQPLRVTVK